ncbi:unnamed protein product [Gemmata massiliana]|uniref:Uncharacterized protein n=1 Tax=Gemmata massiliana TaxID=1210884 RepID=A0A6P2D261_9BACT|nr:unnamed protein product [Gemmata massiliana]
MRRLVHQGEVHEPRKQLLLDVGHDVQEQFGIVLSNQAFGTIKSETTTAGKKTKKVEPKAVRTPSASRHALVASTMGTRRQRTWLVR